MNNSKNNLLSIIKFLQSPNIHEGFRYFTHSYLQNYLETLDSYKETHNSQVFPFILHRLLRNIEFEIKTRKFSNSYNNTILLIFFSIQNTVLTHLLPSIDEARLHKYLFELIRKIYNMKALNTKHHQYTQSLSTQYINK